MNKNIECEFNKDGKSFNDLMVDIVNSFLLKQILAPLKEENSI